MPSSPQPEDTISPTEPSQDPADQNVPVIAMDGSDLEASLGNGSSLELSKDYLFPPGLDVEEERHVFALSDVVNEDDQSFEPWPQDLAGVDINSASDGTYIETSSGPAARELKRRYDQRYGVSVNVRSPYAITAFVNQHGKQMFRVGHRELSAPAASAAEAAAEVEGRFNQPKASAEVSQSPPRSKRRSRLSMVALFPPNVFMPHRPAVSSTNSAPKKLRKARSISDMASIGGSDVSEHGEASNGPPVPTHNGRAHSQSVTAMDMPRFTQSSLVSLAPRNSDIFGDVMDWFTPASSAATTFSSQSFLSGTPSLVHTDNSDSRAIIAHPFGVGVIFDTPLKKPSSLFDHLPPPRHVRLMQSFESGMTARQDDPRTTERPASAIRITEQPPASRPSSTYEPPAEASQLSEYAATVFDVLQTYRGIPNLDNLVEHDTTVKISLSNDLSAVPRDDPRFVIWGEPSADYYDFDVRSSSRDSITSDSASRRRGSKASRAKSPEPSNPPSPGSHRILLAATIERWIAQLTSDLNYDELLDFFLTYRTYISGVDLAHLLISRFQWALQVPKSKQDQSVRQVVRVRTFVAIRYWLLTFFAVDFIPNRELRISISNWLNTLIHDPLLKQHSDGLGIARRLVKVAKDCKRIHIRSGNGGKDRGKSPPPKPERAKSHLFGQKFAEAVMKESEEDSDVDLDFLPDEAMQEEGSSSPTDHANAHIAAGHVGALAPNRPTSLPLSSFNILQRIDQAPVPTNDTADAAAQLAIALPMHNSALSRAFVKTIGRLGRLKRVLHSRSNTRTSLNPCTGVSAFDLELSVSRDLLAANGGVEQYLKGIEARQIAPGSLRGPARQSFSAATPAHNPSPAPASPSPVHHSALSPIPQEPVTPTTPTAAHTFPQHVTSDSASTLSETAFLTDDSPCDLDKKYPLPTPSEEPGYSSFDESEPFSRDETDDISLAPSFRPESIRSFASSTGSLGEVLDGSGRMFSRTSAAYEPFDVVSLDDFDMSDTSSEIHGAGPPAPPGLGVHGLKKQARKLPMRKDFEFLPRRSEISSMGIVSRASVVSDTASSSGSSIHGAGVALGGGIQQWQMNALLDSLSVNEEDGDVDSALRRLEGQINPQKMQEKRSKVDGWVKQIQARLAAGDYEDEEPRFPVDSDEEDGADDEEDDRHESVSQHNVVLYPPGLDDPESTDNVQNRGANQQGLAVPPISSSSSSETGSNARSEDSKPAVEDAVPIEIIRSRVSTILPPAPEPDFPVNIQSKFAAQEAIRIHQSFVLSYRAVTLAEQFSMIDRELFMGVKFEELVTEEQWMATEEVNVYDWSQFLKDRATWKAEHRNAEKTTALAAVRARFNLMSNFVISEIVLTQPNQRPMVVAKFIRVAWKSYQLSNFHGLVAIIAGLKSDPVAHAMRKPGFWNKVGSFETRVYRDLKLFVSGGNDFALIRSAVEAIVENKNKALDNGSHTNSIVGSSADGQAKGKANAESKINTPTACVPFIGIYLAQLHRLKRLPDLIDPTSPNETVGMNSTTGDFDPPAHPEVFDALAPLPPTMRIEPLVNVHKQRKIASVIKSLVAGQHVASRVNYEQDKKLFQRCLRLRALEPDMVQRALAVYD